MKFNGDVPFTDFLGPHIDPTAFQALNLLFQPSELILKFQTSFLRTFFNPSDISTTYNTSENIQVDRRGRYTSLSFYKARRGESLHVNPGPEK